MGVEVRVVISSNMKNRQLERKSRNRDLESKKVKILKLVSGV